MSELGAAEVVIGALTASSVRMLREHAMHVPHAIVLAPDGEQQLLVGAEPSLEGAREAVFERLAARAAAAAGLAFAIRVRARRTGETMTAVHVHADDAAGVHSVLVPFHLVEGGTAEVGDPVPGPDAEALLGR